MILLAMLLFHYNQRVKFQDPFYGRCVGNITGYVELDNDVLYDIEAHCETMSQGENENLRVPGKRLRLSK